MLRWSIVVEEMTNAGYAQNRFQYPGTVLAASPSVTDVVQVMTTVDSREAAQRIARAVVAQRLAACVQIAGPIESTYWWQGEIESSQEWLCIIKSTQETFPALEAAIRAQHPYDVPEILATPVSAGHSAYVDWLREEIRGQ